MNPLMTLGLAFSSIIERPLRSILTSLGIIIGVAAVYAMLALGDGAKKKVEESLNSVSARTINVFPDWGRRRTSQSKPRMPFKESDVDEVRNIPGVMAASGELERGVTIANEIGDLSGRLYGVGPDYLLTEDATLILGENITYSDIENSAPVAMISQSIMERLFNNQDPRGETIKVNNVAFTVKGVFKVPTNNWSGSDLDVWAPISIARERIVGGDRFVQNHVRSLKAVGELGADLQLIEREMNVILQRSRGLKSDTPPDYRLVSWRAGREQAAEQTKAISFLLAVMGAISLLVGGVGVMNIMLVSVTERTREIGLRMALGAKKNNIMGQFLTEALLLCIISGIVGLGVGYYMSKLAMDTMDLDLVFSPQVALISFGASLVIGVVFGFLPARRAARLNPIEALRHE
ncbi:ABC transporter permease [Fretibacter rubidus]|uniref:ABC transporter permease n=1 Tax=Fretibacter rubidus TaxID=570162 RepID=UPI00352A0177